MVRGSHRWNVVYSTHTEEQKPVVQAETRAEYSMDNLGDPGLPLAPDVARYRDSFDILTFDVEPGDALVFQGNMLHGAGGCEGHDRPRRAFATMWGGPQLRYHEPSGKAFPPPGDLSAHPIPDGAPIGEHEAVFPVGWRA
jgi:ectoine hydroxylase-related dioxygenase (phytanoyl-CoA dioxygenase family)